MQSLDALKIHPHFRPLAAGAVLRAVRDFLAGTGDRRRAAEPAIGKLRKVRAENRQRDPAKPCVYVGLTGLTPTKRFANHKAGIKAASLITRYGIRLLPELYAHLNPMPFEAATQMVRDLAEDLRREGYTDTGGH
jgi:hypothetical protein